MNERSYTGIRRYGTYVLVTLVFLILAGSLQALVWLYWDRILEPRLRSEAASQANVLAHSQAVRLADALITVETSKHTHVLSETIDEILLFTGPQTNAPLFLGLDLDIDYDVVSAPPGSLSLAHGAKHCENCFVSEVALYSPITDELLGIARFRVSDSLFRRLSEDVKKTLFTQSRVGMVLLLFVWGVVLILIRAINHSREQAETANLAKSAFLANMSHELRTPLNAIIGFSDLMNRDPDFSPKHKENLSIINRSGNHLLELINDVLELSRIEAAQSNLSKTIFDLYDTLDGVAEMIRLRVEKKKLRFLFERTEDVPRYIRTDERRLRQILLNLLGNAVKFTEEGSVALRVRQEAGGGLTMNNGALILHFEVEDTGPGISSEDKANIFEAFTQSGVAHDKKEGAGLGLAISRQFVEQLGGEIKVNSTLGKGTKFEFNIRAARAAPSAGKTSQKKQRVIGLEPRDGSARTQPYRILVVDDYSENRSLLRLLLEQVGFQVKTAQNGEQAVDLNESWRPHLIWMDMRMPIMDGYEATRIIRETQKGKTSARPVIIALTASAFKEDRDAVLAAGCDDFVRRPYREWEIWDKMREHLGVHFIYEDLEDKVGEDEQRLDDEEISEGIKSLPAEILIEFEKAVESVDFDKSMSVIGRIQEKNGALASYLTGLVNAYQFDVLQKLVERVKK